MKNVHFCCHSKTTDYFLKQPIIFPLVPLYNVVKLVYA